MLKTTSSAVAIVAMLTVGAPAQTADTEPATTAPLQTPAENAGDAVEGALEATGEALEDAGAAAADAAGEALTATESAVESTGEVLRDAGDAAVDATGDAVEATGDAIETTGDAVETTGDAVENATDEATTEVQPPAADGGGMETTTTEVEVQPTEENAERVVEADGADAVPAEGTPVEGQIFEQSADSFLASTLLGTRVQSADGEGIGDVNDMILGADGSVEGVVVGVGGFLGIGEKAVAVQFDAIDVVEDPENGDLTFVLSSSREDLDAAPEFRTQDQIRAEAEARRDAVVPAGAEGAVTVDEAPLPND